MKKVFIINFGIVFFILITLELLANFFKLSNLRGIEKGLINTNHSIHKMIPRSSGVQFGKRIFIDKYGFRSPHENYNYNIIIIGIYNRRQKKGFGMVLKKIKFLLVDREKNLKILISTIPQFQAII